MTRGRRQASFLLLAAVLAACAPDVDIVRPAAPSGGSMFRSYVSIGNSLTAGFQSAGINANTQAAAYPVLIAQAVGTPFRIPSLMLPGCPPPVINFQTLQRSGGGSGDTCALRTAGSVAEIINNVAVPGATSLDPTSRTTSASNVATLLILGGKSQVERAIEAAPSFVSIWIGNNDLLDAALTGIVVATPGISSGITPQPTFEVNYERMLDALAAGADLEGGLLIGVFDPTSAPALFPASALVTDGAFKAAFDQYVGAVTTLLPTCTASTSSLISLAIALAIRAGTHPPTIGCEPEAAPVAPVGDRYVIDANERAAIGAAVAAYNDFIAAHASALGFAYLDPNAPLAALRQGGQIPLVPDLVSVTAPFGAFISLDGVHPSAKGHAILANAAIDVISQEYGLSIPPVPIP